MGSTAALRREASARAVQQQQQQHELASLRAERALLVRDIQLRGHMQGVHVLYDPHSGEATLVVEDEEEEGAGGGNAEPAGGTCPRLTDSEFDVVVGADDGGDGVSECPVCVGVMERTDRVGVTPCGHR